MPAERLKVRVTIDDRTLEVERGTTILDAAKQAGVEIPTLCYHPKVSIIGACRLCLVEVEGMNKLIASCHTPVAEGMMVRTNTPVVKNVRQTMLELLLARHPLDCLVCDKGGWCELQELTFKFGPSSNRFALGQEEYLVKDASPFVEKDTKKCVMCRRCIRVCREIRGVNVWGAMYRGFNKKISTFFHQPLNSDFQDPFNCEFCGSCIDICPVGALTAKPSKYISRPWQVEEKEISCPFCGVGCRTTAQFAAGRLIKTTPVKTEGGSLSDLCFRGRFATVYVNDPSRLTSCMIRNNDRLVPVEKEEALNYMTESIERIRGKLAAFVGTSASEIEAYAMASFLADGKNGNSVLALDSRGELEEGPIPADNEVPVMVDDLAGARKIIVIGQDFTLTHPVAGIRVRQAAASGAKVLLFDTYDTLLGRHSNWWLRPPTIAYDRVIAALARALSEGEKSIPKAVLQASCLSQKEWSAIMSWLKSPGDVSVVFQKIPGGIQGNIKKALSALGSALENVGCRFCYLPLDADGYGVPSMISSAGFSQSQEQLENILAGKGKADISFFLRACPIHESWRSESWKSFRKRSEIWITFDSFLTKTAAMSDLVFPLPHYLEGSGTLKAAGGPGRHEQLYSPPSGVEPLVKIFGEAASALGRPWDDFSSAFQAAVQMGCKSGNKGRKASEKGTGAVHEFPLPVPEKGKFILSVRFHRFPGYRLKVVEARDLLGPRECIEINPRDAAAVGIEGGMKTAVVLKNERFEFEAEITPRVPPGLICLPFDPDFQSIIEFVNFAGRLQIPACGGVIVKLEKG